MISELFLRSTAALRLTDNWQSTVDLKNNSLDHRRRRSCRPRSIRSNPDSPGGRGIVSSDAGQRVSAGRLFATTMARAGPSYSGFFAEASGPCDGDEFLSAYTYIGDSILDRHSFRSATSSTSPPIPTAPAVGARVISIRWLDHHQRFHRPPPWPKQLGQGPGRFGRADRQATVRILTRSPRRMEVSGSRASCVALAAAWAHLMLERPPPAALELQPFLSVYAALTGRATAGAPQNAPAKTRPPGIFRRIIAPPWLVRAVLGAAKDENNANPPSFNRWASFSPAPIAGAALPHQRRAIFPRDHQPHAAQSRQAELRILPTSDPARRPPGERQIYTNPYRLRTRHFSTSMANTFRPQWNSLLPSLPSHGIADLGDSALFTQIS